MDLYLPIASAVVIVVALVLLGFRLGRQFEQLRLDRINGKTRELDLRERMKQLLLDPGILVPAGLVLLLGVGLLRIFLAESLPPQPTIAELLGHDGATQDSVVVAEPEPEPEPPPAPGRLVLAGLPEGAVVLVGGRVRQRTRIPLSPARYRLVVRADGYEDYAQDVRIISGQRNDVTVEMVLISQCATLGPSYNADGSCFDRQPSPKAAPFVPLTADITGTPSQVIIGIKVRADGSVETVTVLTGSDDGAFTVLALRFAESAEYNPAQKDGQPVTAWTRTVFFPGPRRNR